MIVPRMVGDMALAARLDTAPSALRAALVGEATRLGRSLLKRAGGPTADLSLAVESTAETVTVTIGRSGGRSAERRHAVRPKAGRARVAFRREHPHRFARTAAANAGSSVLDAAFRGLGGEIRAGLAAAFRRAFVR